MSESEKRNMPDWESEFYARMLASDVLSGRLNFRYKAYRVGHSDYKKISELIIEGSISVQRFKWVVGAGKPVRRGVYKPGSDTIGLNEKTDPGPYLPYSERVQPAHSIARLKQFGILVHEATHAIQDLKEWYMSVGEREMMAHIAQAIYLLGYGEEMLDDKKMKAALPIAKKLRSREKVTKQEIEDLESVLKEVYGDETWRKKRKGDGILRLEA